MRVDVAVVGAGPAGLATAIGAAREGLSVVVLEHRARPVDKACGEGLMPSAVQRLSDLGLAVDGRPFMGIEYVDGRGAVRAPFLRGTGLGVRRPALEAALLQRAAEVGVEVRTHAVRSVVQHADDVEVDGMRARYVVGADGLHSTVRRLAGIGHRAGRVRRYGLRRHLRIAPWNDHVEVHWASDTEAYVTPVAEREVGIAFLTTEPAPYDEMLARFPVLQRRGAAAPTGDVLGAGPLRRHVDARVRGRIALVGDAAGYVDAITGEGIDVALGCAAGLVDALRRDALPDYERRWREVTRGYRVRAGSLVAVRSRTPVGGGVARAARAAPWVFERAVASLG